MYQTKTDRVHRVVMGRNLLGTDGFEISFGYAIFNLPATKNLRSQLCMEPGMNRQSVFPL